jgi:hypothetical protein
MYTKFIRQECPQLSLLVSSKQDYLFFGDDIGERGEVKII